MQKLNHDGGACGVADVETFAHSHLVSDWISYLRPFFAQRLAPKEVPLAWNGMVGWVALLTQYVMIIIDLLWLQSTGFSIDP